MKLYQQAEKSVFHQSLFVSVIGRVKLIVTISVTGSAVFCVQTISNYLIVFCLVGKLSYYSYVNFHIPAELLSEIKRIR